MEKEVSLKVNNRVITINLYSKGYFELSANIYKLKVYSMDELAEKARGAIEGNFDYFIDDLQDKSINELVDDMVNDILCGNVDYNDDSIYSETKDDNLIQVEWECGSQPYDKLLKLFPDNESIKELVSLGLKYYLKRDVDQAVIDRTVDLLNQLDSGKDEDDLVENMVEEYIKKNY